MNLGYQDHKESPGEAKIRKYLTKNKVLFEQEKKFKTLYNPCTKQPLRVDFWLPEYRTVIEFNGSQHYRIHEKYHSKDPVIAANQLKEQQYRDFIKKLWCQVKNFKLLIITSYQFKQIDKILKKELNELNTKSN